MAVATVSEAQFRFGNKGTLCFWLSVVFCQLPTLQRSVTALRYAFSRPEVGACRLPEHQPVGYDFA